MYPWRSGPAAPLTGSRGTAGTADAVPGRPTRPTRTAAAAAATANPQGPPWLPADARLRKPRRPVTQNGCAASPPAHPSPPAVAAPGVALVLTASHDPGHGGESLSRWWIAGHIMMWPAIHHLCFLVPAGPFSSALTGAAPVRAEPEGAAISSAPPAGLTGYGPARLRRGQAGTADAANGECRCPRQPPRSTSLTAIRPPPP